MKLHHALLLFVLTLSASSMAADPWADSVFEYNEGTGVGAGFNQPTVSLGKPTRFTSPTSPFGGPVTPFNAPFGTDEVVSIGEGGSITVLFEEPVTDDPNNPFGIDLLIFGNSFLGLSEFPADESTTATGVFPEGGAVFVSQDGVNFVEVVGAQADGLFPTLGYTDVTEPFPAAASVPTDFTLPVDPSANVVGLTTSQLVSLYNGSGGGAGIDLGLLGLSEISYVRVTNPIGSGVTPEIDAFADVTAVPEPNALLLALTTFALVRLRR